MLRQLVNVLRYMLQAIRRNVKPLILIVSFLTFIWLIADTVHRPEFVRHASKHSFRFGNRSNNQNERWDVRSVEQFLELLEIDLNETEQAPAACPPGTTLLFTAFVGSSRTEHLWHYLSLIAIQNSLLSATSTQRIEMLMTGTAGTALRQLFASIRTETQAIVDGLLQELYQRAKLYGDEDDVSNLQLVGVHIREDDAVPAEYYVRAITFQRKMHDTGMLMFLVVCENPKGTVCSMLSARSERIVVMAEHDAPDVNFALMMGCNHTIVSGERDIFPPLLRGAGNTVVFGAPSDENRYANELASYLANWFSIV
uniref:Uncharacterized protein n=1 Tax=Anopheles culicifacies TaxID=139723 RepID=A0A182M2T2_9DIPT